MLTRVRLAAVPVAALVAAAGLAACGSDAGKSDAGPKPSESPSSAAPTSYLAVPDGTTLTEPGTQLGLGEEGVIAFERRQDEVAVLQIAVQKIERTTFAASFPGWNLDAATATRTPYFVRVALTNEGETDLGGLKLANVLWASDGATLEAPNYYPADQLPACVGAALPTPFAAGATAELCQVYFIAPGKTLENVTFSPFGGQDPVTWSGAITKVTKPGKPGKKDKQDKKDDKQ
jgi:hypothetical protein